MLTIGIAGYDGGKMAELDSIDYLFVVPSSSVHRIQEAQTTHLPRALGADLGLAGMTADPMEQARAVADAVLYEGYLLYPYRASAAKNKVRWQWGVLMPSAYASERQPASTPAPRTELLAGAGCGARCCTLRLRFLQLQARTVEVPDGDGYRPVPSVVVDGIEYTTLGRGRRARDRRGAPGRGPARRRRAVPFAVAGGIDIEPLPGDCRLVRSRALLQGELALAADTAGGTVWRCDATAGGAQHLAVVAAGRRTGRSPCGTRWSRRTR